MRRAIGIDLGGTNIKGVVLSDTGEILHKMTRETGDGKDGEGSGKNWKSAVLQMVLDLKSASDQPVDVIGLAAPGLPNDTNKMIRIMPKRLSGLENFDWSTYLEEKNVFVLNDAHAAVMAESKFGSGSGVKNIVMLTWGTGVGGGIIINGELFQGNTQIAGHFGHMTVNTGSDETGIVGMPGTLENAIGDGTINKRTCGCYHSTSELVEGYLGGDSYATFVWLDMIRTLSLALNTVCNTLSPDMIILGGGITKAGEALFTPLKRFMSVYEWKNTGKVTPVACARFYEQAGAVGAAVFAMNRQMPGLNN